MSLPPFFGCHELFHLLIAFDAAVVDIVAISDDDYHDDHDDHSDDDYDDYDDDDG